MDIEQLYRDYHVDYVTEGHKHCRSGWVQVPCPFCVGNFGYHMGFDTSLERFVCWRCGGHNPVKALSGILKVGYNEAERILQQYGVLVGKQSKRPKKEKKIFELPSNTTELQERHIKYLESRNFDPEKLQRDWGLLGTGIISKQDGISYKNRILIPYWWDGEIVSFDARDITGKQTNKYQACSESREAIPHKDILYGIQKHWGRTGICVEGTTDVWRMGFQSFAVSGIKYTAKQVRLIAKNFTRVPVLFDDDPQAVVQANKLVGELKFRGVDSFRVDIPNDPGSMTQDEANYLLKQLL